MVKVAERRPNDWLGNVYTNLFAWWLPKGEIVAALFAAVPLRAAIWTVALLWMGGACILNAKRCGRVHCRYTGPYYLAMSMPVILLATGIVPAGFYSWLVLALLILSGGWFIRWATERTWGKYR